MARRGHTLEYLNWLESILNINQLIITVHVETNKLKKLRIKVYKLFQL